MIDPSVLALLLVLGGLVAAPTLIKRHRAAAPDAVRVVGRTALHKNAVVAVVAVGDRRLLVGAGERGVQLLAELDANGGRDDHLDHHLDDPDQPVVTTTSTASTTTSYGRTDAVGTPSSNGSIGAAPDALAGLDPSWGTTIAGPGIGLVDRLRGMTVRTPAPGRPIRVPLRR